MGELFLHLSQRDSIHVRASNRMTSDNFTGTVRDHPDRLRPSAIDPDEFHNILSRHLFLLFDASGYHVVKNGS